MNTLSTRGQAPVVTLSQAIAAGLALDGGLYMPASWPALSGEDFAGAHSLPDVALRLLQPFFADEVIAPALPAICSTALAIDPPWCASARPTIICWSCSTAPPPRSRITPPAFLPGVCQRCHKATSH